MPVKCKIMCAVMCWATDSGRCSQPVPVHSIGLSGIGTRAGLHPEGLHTLIRTGALEQAIRLRPDHGLGKGHEVADQRKRQIGRIPQMIGDVVRLNPFNVPADTSERPRDLLARAPGCGSRRPSILAIVPQPHDVAATDNARQRNTFRINMFGSPNGPIPAAHSQETRVIMTPVRNCTTGTCSWPGRCLYCPH